MSTSPQSPFSEPVFDPITRSMSTTKRVLVVLAILLGVLLVGRGLIATLVLPTVTVATQATGQLQSEYHLKQIGEALRNYHSVFGKLPPAYTTDAAGKPLHSWRVLLLPYLEEVRLYDRFDLKQSWDSPANRALAQPMPEVYHSPLYEQPGTDRTRYLSVRAAQSAFPGPRGLRLEEFIDGTASTVAVVEFTHKAVIWTQPNDAEPADFYAAIHAGNPLGIVALMVDGTVTALPLATSQANLDALMTRNGGDAVSPH